MTALKLVTGPATEPITLTEAKLFLKQELGDDDALITALITAARQRAENYTSRAFIAQTWELSLDGGPLVSSLDWIMENLDEFPMGRSWRSLPPETFFISVPRPPLLSIVSIKYYDSNDSEAIWSSTEYRADTHSEPGRVLLNSGKSWPSGLRPFQSILVTFTAGYGATAADVPEEIKTAIMLTVAHWYENRGSEEIPPEAKRLLDHYRVMQL